MGAFVDIQGCRFGRWVVVGLDPTRAVPRRWLCRCDCGHESAMKSAPLRRGESKSCGCADGRPGNQRDDLSGRSFGRWTVLEYAEKNRHGQAQWRCRCSCGVETVVTGNRLRCGGTKSCGCLSREMRRASATHGHARSGKTSAEYAAWHGAIDRCHRENARQFHHYGGRGIRVCDRWRGSFAAFLEDMGPKPSPKHEIDRVRNDGPYACGRCDDCKARGVEFNCRWATRKEQMNNTRANHMVTHGGETLTLTQWSERTGISTACLFWRLRNKWDVKRALTQPEQVRRRPMRAVAEAA